MRCARTVLARLITEWITTLIQKVAGNMPGLWVIKVEKCGLVLKVRRHAGSCSADYSPDTTVWWIEGHSCWLQYHWYLCSLASDDWNLLAQRRSSPGGGKRKKCQVRVSLKGNKWSHSSKRITHEQNEIEVHTSKTRNRICDDGWDVGAPCAWKSADPAALYYTMKVERHVNQKGYSFPPNQRDCSWSQGFQTHLLPHKRCFFLSSRYIFNKKPQQLHSQIRLFLWIIKDARRRVNSWVFGLQMLAESCHNTIYQEDNRGHRWWG